MEWKTFSFCLVICAEDLVDMSQGKATIKWKEWREKMNKNNFGTGKGHKSNEKNLDRMWMFFSFFLCIGLNLVHSRKNNQQIRKEALFTE